MPRFLDLPAALLLHLMLLGLAAVVMGFGMMLFAMGVGYAALCQMLPRRRRVVDRRAF